MLRFFCGCIVGIILVTCVYALAVTTSKGYTVFKSVPITNPVAVDIFASGVAAACSEIDAKAQAAPNTCAGHMATPTAGSCISICAVDTDGDGVSDVAHATATFMMPGDFEVSSP
jgi:hypothetical protein